VKKRGEQVISTPNNEKITRTFMKDEAHQKLRSWIISGKLGPGTKLRDKELSEMLGISRTPVREALLMLESDGLIETKANRWTIVTAIDLDKAEENYSIVWTLEALAMKLAFPNFSVSDIDEMKALNEQFKILVHNGEEASALEMDNAFHNKIIQLSKNEELRKLLVSVKLKIQRIESHYFSQKEFLKTSYDEHCEIIQSIINKDVKRAEDAIVSNWKKSLARLRE